MKKSILIFMIALLISVVAAGSHVFASGEAESGTMDEPEGPTEITIWMVQRANEPTDNPIWNELQERTNIKINWQMAPEGNESEKFQLAMVGDMPDLFIFDQDQLAQYVPEGAFAPLDDLIKEHAPNIKKHLLDKPELRRNVTGPDGKVYFIPIYASQFCSETFLIRGDWLERLDLEKPKTTDEWYEVLKAFKEKDANGNGDPDDEVPFINRQGYEKTVAPFAMSFGIKQCIGHNAFYDNGNGVIVYGPAQPGFKDALLYMNKLYEEGLIDQEYAVIDKAMWTMKASTGMGGAMHDWQNRMESFTQAVQEEDSEGYWTWTVPPKGPDGTGGYTTYQMDQVRTAGNLAITADSDVKEKIIQVWDYIFSEEGSKLMQLGIKGEHWIEKEDGSIEFTQKVWDKAEEEGLGIQMARNYFGMGRNCPNGIPDMRAYEAMNVTQDRIDCIETYESGIIIPKFPPVVHTPAEDEVINDKFTEIRTFVEEQIDLFVMGSQELTDDKWDWYIESIKDSGLAEVVAVKQSAYDRYKDKSK